MLFPEFNVGGIESAQNESQLNKQSQYKNFRSIYLLGI